MTWPRKILIFLLAFSLTQITACQTRSKQTETAGSISLPRATPQEVGLSAERLNRIQRVMQRYVAEGRIAGAVTLVMRQGKVAQLEAIGEMDEGKSMREDAIFRIASMTKPITSVAVMMLVEEGKFSLDEPVSKYIPEFKSAQVAILDRDKKSFTLVSAKSEITIRNLLTHTSGITYRFEGIDPWATLYKDAGVSDGLTQTKGTIGDEVKKLGKLPLMHHPGEKFSYGLSIDVLGYLVEVVSRMTLDEFFRKRIFERLKMKDTYFYLPPEKLSRLAAVYVQLPDGRIKRMGDEPVEDGHVVYSASYQFKGPRTYYSGGVGLVSTTNDYARFLQMLLNGGELDGVRILSRKTVELMTVNQIGELHSAVGLQGFGLGFGLLRDLGRSDELETTGQYGWSGFFHTAFFVDPQEKMIGIFMSQLYPSDMRLHERFRSLAYQTIID